MEIEAPEMCWRSNTCGKHTKIRSRIGLQRSRKIGSAPEMEEYEAGKIHYIPWAQHKDTLFCFCYTCLLKVSKWLAEFPTSSLGQEPLNSVNLLVLQMDIWTQKHSSPKFLPPNISSGWRHSFFHPPVWWLQGELVSCLICRMCLHLMVVSCILSSIEKTDCSALGIPFASHEWTS